MAPWIDDSHQGPLINIASWLTMVPMILFTMTKVWTKWKMTRTFQLDDGFMIFGTLVGIAQTINLSIEVNNGLGTHQSELTDTQFETFQKMAYISQILYLVTISFAKMAAAQFLITLTKTKRREYVVRGLLALITSWFMVSVFSVSFQCDFPDTWNTATGKCFHISAFWIANAVVDLLTQVLLVLVPVCLIWDLKMAKKRKRVAMLSFSPNITTAPLTIIRLIYLLNLHTKTDLPFTTFKIALITEIHSKYSIIASCIPFMRPLVEALAVGLVTNDIFIPEDDESNPIKENSRRISRVNPFALRKGSWSNLTRDPHARAGHKSMSAKQGVFTSTISGGSVGQRVELEALERGKKSGSEEKMIINQTKTTSVSSETPGLAT